MNKVKISQEQADILVRENSNEKHNTVKRFVEIYGEHGRSFHLDELIRALYIGYEVETTYKVGDWVINKNTKRAIEVDEPKVDFLNKDYSHGKIFRHATPEEIAKGKERRTNKKLNDLLFNLSSEEQERLYEKLVLLI